MKKKSYMPVLTNNFRNVSAESGRQMHFICIKFHYPRKTAANSRLLLGLYVFALPCCVTTKKHFLDVVPLSIFISITAELLVFGKMESAYSKRYDYTISKNGFYKCYPGKNRRSRVIVMSYCP